MLRFCWYAYLCPVGREFKKIELNESIRYAPGDPIESWLNGLLCLDASNSIPNISRLVFPLPFECWSVVVLNFLLLVNFVVISRLPHPKECDLYYINRDTLFSYHKESEIFLQVTLNLFQAFAYFQNVRFYFWNDRCVLERLKWPKLHELQ